MNTPVSDLEKSFIDERNCLDELKMDEFERGLKNNDFERVENLDKLEPGENVVMKPDKNEIRWVNIISNSKGYIEYIYILVINIADAKQILVWV